MKLLILMAFIIYILSFITYKIKKELDRMKVELKSTQAKHKRC